MKLRSNEKPTKLRVKRKSQTLLAKAKGQQGPLTFLPINNYVCITILTN